MRYMVVKTFEATRTPCPQEGTCGEFVRRDGLFYVLQFSEPFVDSEGARWTPGDDGMRIKFHEDEIRPVIEKVS